MSARTELRSPALLWAVALSVLGAALERLGHVEARWDVAESGRRRKYYRITSQGRAQLAEERRQWQAVDATLRGIWQALSLPVAASHWASAAPLPQGA